MIPKKLKDISFKQYVDLMNRVSQEQKLEDIIEAFIGSEKYKKLTLKEVEQQGINLNLLLMEKPKLHYKIELDGQTLYFHSDLENITTAEFADIETYQRQGLATNLHNILAVLYRPKKKWYWGKRYELIDYKGTEDRPKLIQKYMNGEQAAAALVFFSTLIKD